MRIPSLFNIITVSFCNPRWRVASVIIHRLFTPMPMVLLEIQRCSAQSEITLWLRPWVCNKNPWYFISYLSKSKTKNYFYIFIATCHSPTLLSRFRLHCKARYLHMKRIPLDFQSYELLSPITLKNVRKIIKKLMRLLHYLEFYTVSWTVIFFCRIFTVSQ